MIKWIKNLFGRELPDGEALSWCVPETIFCCWLWAVRNKDPVRIAVQNIRPGVDHCQAEAKINGEWTPLTPMWSDDSHRIAVKPWHRHFNIEPYRTVPLRDWIDEQIKFTEE